MNDVKQFVVVSNRLPFSLAQQDDGEWAAQPSSGGLVTALVPILQQRQGIWIGWPGTVSEQIRLEQVEEVLAQSQRHEGCSYKPVLLSEEEKNDFYYGFSNEVIWPLFHDFPSWCVFEPHYWDAYQRVNQKFADAVCRYSPSADLIWVHDYHLMGVGSALRARGQRNRLAFFLHIPFPPVDIFMKLPWREKLLRSLLEYDLIGFQTQRDRRNFTQCLKAMLGDELILLGKGQVLRAHVREREIRIGTFPIGIDAEDFSFRAASPEVSHKAWVLHEAYPNRQIILGIDRLDYTKGIPHRIKAFQNALARFPELHKKVSLIQIVVPSREDIPQYHQLKNEIERLVGTVNGEFTETGWVPIHYIYRSLDFPDLLAYYRTAEIALITPLKDGMNLVAKEYCASSVDDNGILILSEFAGAASQLQSSALLVNPYDIENVADTIRRAFFMHPGERRMRLRKMKRIIRSRNVFWWVDTFLQAALAGKQSLPAMAAASF